DDHLAELTQENVLMQIKHLETHPSVAAKMATGDLMIHGWVYDIPHGEVSCYDSKEEKFVSIAAYYKKLFG
ncbi:MAG: carbonic anhydrase, partial [Gammaproteobacteria bacterium]